MKNIGSEIAVWLSVGFKRPTFDLDVAMFIYIVCTWHTAVNIHRYYTLFILHSDFSILKIESLEFVISLTGTTFAT